MKVRDLKELLSTQKDDSTVYMRIKATGLFGENSVSEVKQVSTVATFAPSGQGFPQEYVELWG